jgi:hypothetical protein
VCRLEIAAARPCNAMQCEHKGRWQASQRNQHGIADQQAKHRAGTGRVPGLGVACALLLLNKH